MSQSTLWTDVDECNGNWRYWMAEFARLKPYVPVPTNWRSGESGWPGAVGRAVPRALDRHKTREGEIGRYIGWRPCAIKSGLALAIRLAPTLLAQPCCWLVIACNRPRAAQGPVPELAEGTRVHVKSSSGDAAWPRWHKIHAHFHAARFSVSRRDVRVLVAVHIIAPQCGSGRHVRSWFVDLHWRHPRQLVTRIARSHACEVRPLPFGLDEPCAIRNTFGPAVRVHAESRRIRHFLHEVRNGLQTLADAAASMPDRTTRVRHNPATQ